ncbi:MAG TPA: hypothetical protein VK574_12875 [Terracidiphilus sp.]|nr:hypothetical protein [Terracidiphilus sp.]
MLPFPAGTITPLIVSEMMCSPSSRLSSSTVPSIAGEELSSIGSRHPEKIADLIHLDAAFAYAFYDPVQGNLLIDAADLKRRLKNLVSSAGPREQEAALKELQRSILPQFEEDLKTQEDDLAKIPEPPAAASKPPEASPIVKAILMGKQKYTSIKVPVLAICAVPHDLGSRYENDPVARAAGSFITTRISSMAYWCSLMSGRSCSTRLGQFRMTTSAF